MKPILSSSTRYIALDIHKHYAVVAAVDREGQVLLKPRKVTNEQLSDWATGHLFAEDRVVIESTTNAWHVYDLLAPLVAEVKVANPIRVKQIAEARTKTDQRDTLILAVLLAANLIPEIWVRRCMCASYAFWSPNGVGWSRCTPKLSTACIASHIAIISAIPKASVSRKRIYPGETNFQIWSAFNWIWISKPRSISKGRWIG